MPEGSERFEQVRQAVSSAEYAPSPTTLHLRATNLLKVDGVNDAIDGQRAKVTEHYGIATLGDETYYGRVARVTESKEDQPLLIALDRTPELPISTTNLYTLRFAEIHGGAELFVDSGDFPQEADNQTRLLVKTILDDIAVGHKRDYVEPINSLDRLKKAASRHLTLKKAVIAFLITAGAYGHVPFTEIDAHVGDYPAPQPFEGFEDLRQWHTLNTKRVEALRAEEMRKSNAANYGAAKIVAGEALTVPLVVEYDTRSYSPLKMIYSTNDTMYANTPDGLSKVDILITDPDKPNRFPTMNGTRGLSDYVIVANDDTVKNDGTCFQLRGPFGDGKSSVFTSDVDFNDKFDVKATDATTLEICTTEGLGFQGEDIRSGLFVYNPPQS